MRGVSRSAGSVRTAAACAGLLALVSPSTLVAHPSPHANPSRSGAAERRLPPVPDNYDLRDELAAARAGKVAVDAARAAAAERLAAAVPGLVLHADAVSTLPKMVTTVAPGERLSGPLAARAAGDPVAAARSFLGANRDLYGLGSRDLADTRVVYVSGPKAGAAGATIVRFEQTIGDVRVFGAELAVVMDPGDLAVAGTSGTLYPGAHAGAPGKAPALSMRDALARAAVDITGRAWAGAEFEQTGVDDAGYARFVLTADRVATASPSFGEGLRVREVIFPVAAGEMIPAYYAEVDALGPGGVDGPMFSVVVGAEDGRVLFRNNLVADEAFTYRVFADATGTFRPLDSPHGIASSPHPTGVPDGFQAAGVAPVDVAVESLLGPTDPWLAPGAAVTTGNNVDAYLDISGSDGFTANDIRGQITAPGQFVHDFDHTAATQSPAVRQSKAVHMFYFNNWLHDVWYQQGFDEPSRNAQTDNYGRGGAGNDSIKAEGEDQGNIFGNTNNANMSTPADGGRPRMQMYRFDGPSPERDSSHDFGIVAHEWMHYMSNRLVGNANGLGNNQGRSMGEGWGDWCGLIVSVREGDDLDGLYTTGAWATYQLWTDYVDNYYFGIRRYPYSTRMDRNPQTFKDIGPGQTFPAGVPRNTNVGTSPSEYHNAGEIWCAMLWEASVSLMKTYGVDAGRNRIMRYVADGMKSTPSSPTYVQARDGIITAANASDPNDVALIWQALSRRGIGEGAVSPTSSSSSHSGVVESFVAPNASPDDTVGVAALATFFGRNVLMGGEADYVANYGAAGLLPLAGNWDGGAGVGADGADTLGAYAPATGTFFLRNANTGGEADMAFTFGAGGALVPIAGDWDGDGATSVGVYDPATGAFFLRNSNAPGEADLVVFFGAGNLGYVPVAGDWDSDGTDTIGLYDPTTGFFFLRNSNAPGAADLTFTFGPAGAFQPVAGDWDSDGVDTVGIYDPATRTFYLRNSNTAGTADRSFVYGPAGPIVAYAGNFDGQ